MVNFFNEKTLKILGQYPLFNSFLEKKMEVNEFIGNLVVFRKDLIQNGISEDEIDVLKGWALGTHPKEGMIKSSTGEYSQKNAGWKTHLNVPIKNHKEVYEWLRSNCPYGCKYAHHSGQVGKDFTIYIGSWDKTEMFAKTLEDRLGSKLAQPEGTLIEELQVEAHIVARFEIVAHNKFGFSRYGYYGLPILQSDWTTLMYQIKRDNPNRISFIKKSIENAYQELNRMFGVYFRGSNNQVTEYVIEFLNRGIYDVRNNRLFVLRKKR